MKPQSEYTMKDLDKAISELSTAMGPALVYLTDVFASLFPPPPPLTPWQRFAFAVDDIKETMIAGMRHAWLYVLVFWLGIVVGSVAGWLEWGVR